jgi:hypothetical protein
MAKWRRPLFKYGNNNRKRYDKPMEGNNFLMLALIMPDNRERMVKERSFQRLIFSHLKLSAQRHI